jgi:hypothetical protein
MRVKELVGTCAFCGCDLYCLDGFFNGVILSDGRLACFDCDKENEKANQSKEA